MSKAASYYYDQLNKEQQKAYYAMKEGLLAMEDSFAVPMLSGKELSDIYFMLRMKSSVRLEMEWQYAKELQRR